MSIPSAYTEKSCVPGRLRSLVVEDGQLQITVKEGDLPAFLLEANQAVCRGRIDQARQYLGKDNIAQINRHLARDGTRTDVMFIVAKLLLDTHQPAHAEAWFRKILEIEPHPAVLKELADLCFRATGRRTEALAYSTRAYRLAPEGSTLCSNYGRDLIYAGRIEEGVRILNQAAQIAPDNARCQASCLWYRHYLPEDDRGSFFQAYTDWGRRFAPLHLCCYDHLNRPGPERRLRIGYISPDFCRHSVAYTFEPILDGHDRSQVEVFGYGNVADPDETTQRLQAKFDRYRDVHGLHPEHLAKQIHLDRIDILMALGGHCAGNALAALAYKPAPIQVDLGGISTTGMEQIDYRISDKMLDPPDTQAFYIEELVYLPNGFVSYCPPEESPLIEPLPSQTQGHITFGSFNNHIKINDFTLALWCRVLNAVPNAQIILKFQAGHDRGLQAFYRERFVRHGIAADRVHISGMMSHFEHLRLLGQVDIALDTFPFNGCVTTLEGLWMGVPVLTLNGTTYVAQVGRNIMTQLGLETFVACHPDEFVAKACAFADQLESLASIRGALRGLMLNSPLCSPGRVARALESVYRRMWRRWFDTQT